MLSTRRILPCMLAVLAVAISTTVVHGQVEVHEVEVHEVDFSATSMQQEHQHRRLGWDLFGFLMMMVSSECGPGSGIHLGDHHDCHECTGMKHNMNACNSLCEKGQSDDRKASYVRFCESSGSSSSSSSSASSVNEADGSASYSENTTPGGADSGGAFAKGFEWWMLAAAAAVLMAMAAIHMGQRKDNSQLSSDRSMMTGAVGRRFTAVNAFANGIFPTKRKGAVEMASGAALVAGGAAAAAGHYQLDGDDATAPVELDNVSTSSPIEQPDEEGVEQSYMV